MATFNRNLVVTGIVFAVLGAGAADARDLSRQPVASQTPAAAIPNPYAAAPSADRAADAYATGFAIGLGTALINKQREDELKRQRDQGSTRR